jgi:integrase
MDPQPVTLAAYAAEWSATLAAFRKPRTVETYRLVLGQHWLPALGPETPLAAITRAQVCAVLVAKREAGYARTTVRHMLAVLRALFYAARDVDGLVARNPAARLGYLVPRRHGPRRSQALSRADLERLLATARRDYPVLAVLFLVLARTGLRLGEALGLQWPDVDFARAELVLTRAIDWRYRVDTPKDGAGAVLPLARDACTALRIYRETIPWHGIPGADGGGWVFHGPSGRPWSRTWVRAVLIRCCAEARVRPIGPHALRHTFGTHLADLNVDPLAIRDLLRHHSVVETEGYLGVRPGQRAALRRLVAGRRRG